MFTYKTKMDRVDKKFYGIFQNLGSHKFQRITESAVLNTIKKNRAKKKKSINTSRYCIRSKKK